MLGLFVAVSVEVLSIIALIAGNGLQSHVHLLHSTFDQQYMIHANVSSNSLLFKIKNSIKQEFKWGTKEKSSKEKKDFLVTQLRK